MSEQLFEGEAITSGIGRLAIPAAEGISGWTMNVPYRVGKAGEVELSDNLAWQVVFDCLVAHDEVYRLPDYTPEPRLHEPFGCGINRRERIRGFLAYL